MTTTYVNDITVVTKIVAITCNAAACGVVFGLSAEFMAARKDDHRTWYCPNGHPRAWHQDNEEERLRRRLQDQRAQTSDMYERLTAARELAQRENRRAAAFKGHATRLRNRIAQGFCPAGCDQQFPDIQGHLATEHPDFHLSLGGDQ